MNNQTAKDDEIDLLELFEILWQGKWLILLTAALFGMVAFIFLRVTPPTWQADLLLKVESKNSSIGQALIGDLGDILNSTNNESDAQIEIIKSRSLLGQTVTQFNLDKQLSLPFSWERFIRPKPAIQPSQVIFRLDLPNDFHKEESRLVLYIKDNDYVELQNNGFTILSGKQGEVLQANGYTLFFDGRNNTSLVGEVLHIDLLSNIQAIHNLREQLSILLLDKRGALLKIRLIGKDPHYIEQLLNNIANNYVQRVNDQSVEKITQGVDFIEKQLPDVKVRLEQSERALRDYQVNHKTIGVNVESETIIQSLAQIEAELTNLQLKENELLSRYTINHPSLQSLAKQQKTLYARKEKIERQLDSVPKSTQEIIQLKRDVEVNQTVYLQLIRKLQELKIIKASSVSGVQIIDSAQAGARPIKPNKSLVIAGAIFAGIMLSSLLLLIKNLLLVGNRILTIEDIANSTGLNVIATIPKSKKQKGYEKKLFDNFQRMDETNILSITDPQDISIEALRSLRTNLFLSFQDKNDNKTLLISGPTEDVGKTFISYNLAVLFAQAGKKIVLVNGDLRKSYLNLVFKSDNGKKNLGEYLQQTSLAPETCIHKTLIENLDFIPSGRNIKYPLELLSNTQMRRLMTFLNRNYDFVLIDTPPILPVSDALYLAQYARGILLVTKFNQTYIRELKSIQQKINLLNINIFGVIINNIENNKHYKYHYY